MKIQGAIVTLTWSHPDLDVTLTWASVLVLVCVTRLRLTTKFFLCNGQGAVNEVSCRQTAYLFLPEYFHSELQVQTLHLAFSSW